MFAWVARALGGYAMSRPDLRRLYAVTFLSFLGVSVTFPLRLLYAQAHHATPVQIGILAASFLIAPLLSQIPMGWLVDRWGRVPMIVVALISHAIITLLYIVLNSPIDLIVLRFLEGVTVSALQPATAAYIADVTPEEHRSEAYGVLGAVLSSGMLIGPLVGGLIGQYGGFAAAFVVNFVVEVIAVALIPGQLHEPVEHRERREKRPSVPWSRLFSIPLAGAYVAFFCTQIVMGVLGSLWSIWVRDLGGSYTYIGLTFSAFAAPQIFFGGLAGRMGQRMGRARLLLGAGLGAAVIYASYGYVTSLVAIMVLGVIEGVFIVFQTPLAQGLLADVSPPDARGRAQGVAGAAGAIGGASAAFASLPLYHWSRASPFIMAGVVMAVGSVMAAFGAIVWENRRREQTMVLEDTITNSNAIA